MGPYQWFIVPAQFPKIVDIALIGAVTSETKASKILFKKDFTQVQISSTVSVSPSVADTDPIKKVLMNRIKATLKNRKVASFKKRPPRFWVGFSLAGNCGLEYITLCGFLQHKAY